MYNQENSEYGIYNENNKLVQKEDIERFLMKGGIGVAGGPLKPTDASRAGVVNEPLDLLEPLSASEAAMAATRRILQLRKTRLRKGPLRHHRHTRHKQR